MRRPSLVVVAELLAQSCPRGFIADSHALTLDIAAALRGKVEYVVSRLNQACAFELA